jgi:hypothetical protein
VIRELFGENLLEFANMAATVALLDGVSANLMTSLRVFQGYLGSVTLNLTEIFFFFAFLRFEAIGGSALPGAELNEVVETFVKGASVGGLVAEIQRKLLFVFDIAGIGVEAGVLQALGALSEPERFGHAVNQDQFGGRGGLMLVEQRLR